MTRSSRIVLLSYAWVAVLLISSSAAFAQKLSARSQFRRTVDPSERSAVGSLQLRQNGSLETVDIEIRGLSQNSFATYYSPTPNFPMEPDTNFFVYSVSPLDRSNAKKGNWVVHLVGTNQSPPLIPFITDLNQVGADQFSIGRVDDSALIVGVTNVIGNLTNIVMGIPVPIPNKTNSVTITMWAPAPALVAKPSALSYRRKVALTIPAVPPVPNAKGSVKYSFNGATGRSTFEVDVSNLPRGQTPHVFIADSTNTVTYTLIDAGTMTPTPSGRTDRFIRDTQFGDPLPQQARDAGDLSGHIIQILDLNGNPPFVYLEGVIP